MTESSIAGKADVAPGAGASARPGLRGRLGLSRRLGLSGKLLILTLLFVLLATVLIYVPTVANFHRSVLTDRLAAAQVAALVLDAAPDGMAPRELEVKLLDQIGAAAVAVKTGERRRLLASTDNPPALAREIDLRNPGWGMIIMHAVDTLVGPGDQMIRAVGAGMDRMDFVEVVLPERPIRRALRDFSINFLYTSLFIAGLTALLVYFTLHFLIVRPVGRLSRNVAAFAADPENMARVIAPSGRNDEIGVAETALADMETSLARELRQKKHLAALGLAVSKINHDLRNMLASAQLISDRLAQAADPLTQRLAPKLVSALDRAIAFCQSTLAYGRAGEREPARETVLLSHLVHDVSDNLGLDSEHPVKVREQIPDQFELRVDREQIYRTLLNLLRNAVQVLTSGERAGGSITIAASRTDDHVVIDIDDDGPGIEPKLRARLFEAFNTTGRPGGTGLGLAIAAELVQLHGGKIALRDSERGAAFRITLPGA